MAPTDIGTEHRLRGKWQQIVVKFSHGLCIVLFRMPASFPCCHTASAPPVLWSCICAPRVLRWKCMSRASFKCIGSLYVYRPLLSNCHDEGASNEVSISGKSGSIAQWPSRSDCSLLLFKARLLAGCPSVHLKRHLSFQASWRSTSCKGHSRA